MNLEKTYYSSVGCGMKVVLQPTVLFISIPTITGNITEWNFVDAVFITKSNFEFNNTMSFRKKIERA